MKNGLFGVALGLVVFGAATRADNPLRGPLPREQKDAIHFLAEHHAELSRKVTLTEDGYTALTTSENPEVAAKLLLHFRYMKARLDSGAMVRRWDPAFAEMVAYHDQLEAEVTALENGLKVVVRGKTPAAVKVARNHAQIVSGFVAEGQAAVQRAHAAVVETSEE